MQLVVLIRSVLNYSGELLINAFDRHKLLPTGSLNKDLDNHLMGFGIKLGKDDSEASSAENNNVIISTICA